MGIVADRKPTLGLRYDTQPRVSLVGDDAPSINLTNDDGINIVELGKGPLKAGHLLLGDAQGNGMVDAGITENGVGAVQTFPNGGNLPGRTFFGLPGTFICGIGCPR